MSKWNYRWIQYPEGDYGLHEVFYDKEGKITAWSETASFVLDDLSEDCYDRFLEKLEEAYNTTILSYNELISRHDKPNSQ